MNHPPRTPAVLLATLVVSLQCGWLLGGCLLHIAQRHFRFGDEWFDRLVLPKLDEPVFFALGSASLLVCQFLAVQHASKVASVIVGVVFLTWGFLLFVGTTLVYLWPSQSSDRTFEATMCFAWMAAVIAAGSVMFRWHGQITRHRFSPLPATPPSAEDD